MDTSEPPVDPGNAQQASDWGGDTGALWASRAATFERIGAAYDAHLLTGAGLTPTSAVLDVGCGAGLFLAANQINSVPFGARAVIADHDDMLVVRTERDVPCAAGLSDAQLGPALQAAVDGVLGAQDAMVAAAEEMTKLGEQADSAGAESADADSAD